VAGVVQARRVSVGDFVSVGQPLFDIVVADRLQAIAPFPETVGDSLRVGQKAYVAPVRAPENSIDAAITELRPRIGAGSRSVDAILEFANPGGWRAGGSVTVAVVVDARARSVTVPSESIVRRPAGTVVYVAEEGTARQRVVRLGVQTADWVEVLEGLEGGEPVVTSGAGFLTDGTAIDARQAAE
jgi:RND family efflux transporter MFP subunit